MSLFSHIIGDFYDYENQTLTLSFTNANTDNCLFADWKFIMVTSMNVECFPTVNKIPKVSMADKVDNPLLEFQIYLECVFYS